jgi:hypothetical protein
VVAKSWHLWFAPVFATLTAAATILAFVGSRRDSPRFAVLLIAALRSHGYGFQVEMTYRAVRAGAHVIGVPITFHERMAGRSKMSPAIVFDAFTMVTSLAMTRRERPVVAHERVDH